MKVSFKGLAVIVMLKGVQGSQATVPTVAGLLTPWTSTTLLSAVNSITHAEISGLHQDLMPFLVITLYNTAITEHITRRSALLRPGKTFSSDSDERKSKCCTVLL